MVELKLNLQLIIWFWYIRRVKQKGTRGTRSRPIQSINKADGKFLYDHYAKASSVVSKKSKNGFFSSHWFTTRLIIRRDTISSNHFEWVASVDYTEKSMASQSPSNVGHPAQTQMNVQKVRIWVWLQISFAYSKLHFEFYSIDHRRWQHNGEGSRSISSYLDFEVFPVLKKILFDGLHAPTS